MAVRGVKDFSVLLFSVHSHESPLTSGKLQGSLLPNQLPLVLRQPLHYIWSGCCTATCIVKITFSFFSSFVLYSKASAVPGFSTEALNSSPQHSEAQTNPRAAITSRALSCFGFGNEIRREPFQI